MVSFEQPLLLLLFIPIGILVLLTWQRMSLPFPRSQRYLILAARLLLFVLIVTALAEQYTRTQVKFSQFESTPETTYTELAAALRLAAAILPQDSQKRIIL